MDVPFLQSLENARPDPVDRLRLFGAPRAVGTLTGSMLKVRPDRAPQFRVDNHRFKASLANRDVPIKRMIDATAQVLPFGRGQRALPEFTNGPDPLYEHRLDCQRLRDEI